MSVAAAFGLSTLAACNSVKEDTYAVAISGDQSHHEVELNIVQWRPGHRRKFVPVMRLRFPTAYYNYRDNQTAYRQSKIGLSLNKRTYGPLALDLIKQTRSTDQSKLLRAHAANSDNEIFVKIGSEGFEPRSGFEKREPIGTWGVFTIYKPRVTPAARPNCPNPLVCKFGEEIYGGTQSGPEMDLTCVARGLCSVGFIYRDRIVVRFYVPPKDVIRAPDIRASLIALLKAHELECGSCLRSIEQDS